MIKKFFVILTVFIAAGAGLLFYSISFKKTLITPYPYSFGPSVKKSIESESFKASSAKILIIGDRMGANLDPYTPAILEDLSQNFKTPPEIYNWSRQNEGLHRTLFKLKSLKKFPPIIIYHGASSELFEKTFNTRDYSAIMKNFDVYDNEKLISLIITFPWISKILYKKMDYIELGDFKPYKNALPPEERMKEKEIAFKLFDYQLRELIDLVKDKKSNLLLITTPLNLEVHPQETCAQSSSSTIVEVQQEIEAMIKNGEYKAAFPKITELARETYSNAKSYYLLGKINLGLGELAEARAALYKSTIFDCQNWRGNAVFNAIMKTQAKNRQVMLVDFDQHMASQLSQEGLFIDDIYPQNIFYQRMVNELLINLKKILSINE